ncbi:hypothetical protein CTEN210_16098 [Chaetoceros tenuissimus]|uniref:AP2/ERF domain-containing protein n=1 Tax=Chaetoceros tenuissimus TaxID=426638 RepID=A0AAD3D811_9STRA|nr:hypothetical protein CTEN210_16098 [Chaetoceros tenuissimus]
MPNTDDPKWASNTSSNINPLRSRGLSRLPVLGKRQERSKFDKSELARKERKKSSKYTGVCWRSYKQTFTAQFQYKKQFVSLGSFKLQADAAKAYDQALLLIPRTLYKSPNFANEEEYQTAREDEITMRQREFKSQMKLESFTKQFTPIFLNESQILAKCGLTSKSNPTEQSPFTPFSSISPKDSNDNQSFLAHEDTDSVSKIPRTLTESKLPNKSRKFIKEEVVDLVSSDEEDTNEFISSPKHASVQSIKNNSIGTESVSISDSGSVKLEDKIMDSKIVQTCEKKSSFTTVAEYRPAMEETRDDMNEPDQATKGKGTAKHSKYLGVCWLPSSQMFSATIVYNGKIHQLGRFKLQSNAAKAYDQALLLIPRTSHRSAPNFANEEAYKSAREDEIRRITSDGPEQAKKESKKTRTKSSEYIGVSAPTSGRFRAQIQYDKKHVSLGRFDLHADAAKAYDQALLSIPRARPTSPNFANEEEYQTARENEIRVRYGLLKSKMKFESFVKQFAPPQFFNETQVLAKCGLTPKSNPTEESPSTPSSTVSPKDSNNDQGFLAHNDKEFFSNDDSCYDEADLRKAKVPRLSTESKLPNKGRKFIKEEVVDLASSDEEGNDESMSISAVAPDESMKSTTSKRTESISVSSSRSVKVKEEEIVESRVVENPEANTADFAFAENLPATEENQADNEINTIQVSPTHNTTTNENSAHLVLKTPLIQILQIQHLTDAMEKEIEEYCRTLFYEKCCWNEKYFETLKGLSQKELEEMLGFMQPW